jgi:uncharacterized repeat protein (TIGR03803 family)
VKEDPLVKTNLNRGMALLCGMLALVVAGEGQFNQTVLHDFSDHWSGAKPNTGVVRDASGALYGITAQGGKWQRGVVYKVASGKQTVLHNFTGGWDGGEPVGGVILDAQRNIYGTTRSGGGYHAGVVYKLDATRHETVLHTFGGDADGTHPASRLILDSAGNLYGTTTGGGAYNHGVVFKLDPQDNETLLHSFAGGADGAQPLAGVTMDAHGNLYGTTLFGGSGNAGVVFEITAGGTESVLHAFQDRPDARHPEFGVTLDAAGNLYGTTTKGGRGDMGAIYKIDPSGNETIIHSFGEYSGFRPSSGLTADAAGNLYGVTAFGGALNGGVVYKIGSRGNETVLYNAAFGSDAGSQPKGDLAVDSNGNVYGTMYFGGPANLGVVFEVDASGQESILYGIPGGPDGAYPYTTLAVDASGNIYGTSRDGGEFNQGIVYKVDTTGQESVLYSLSGAGAEYGFPSAVVLDAGGNIYGVTARGGTAGSGMVYKVDPAGTATTVYNFTGKADGFYATSIAVDGSGNLYVTSIGGGANNKGTVLKIDAAGNASVLHSFSGTDGSNATGLALDASGNLYGTASYGGTGCTSDPGCGVVFKIDSSNSFTVLHNFTGGSDGAEPFGSPLVDASGNIYGTTDSGGPVCSCGTIYRIDSSGNETIVHSFAANEGGGNPNPGLAKNASGNLYGTTKSIVFEVSPAGNLTTIWNFSGRQAGYEVLAGVALDAAGNIYGTTAEGGQRGGRGLVFKLSGAVAAGRTH